MARLLLQLDNMKTPSAKQSGFSLVELLVVMALIAIVASISIPGIIQLVPKFNMKGATRDVAAKLMVARLMAIHQNKNYSVLFTDAAPDSYKVEVFDEGAWVDENDAGYEATGDVDVVASGGVCAARVVFAPNGTSSGCTTITLTASTGETGVIVINLVSGHIGVTFTF